MERDCQESGQGCLDGIFIKTISNDVRRYEAQWHRNGLLSVGWEPLYPMYPGLTCYVGNPQLPALLGSIYAANKFE